MSESQNFSLTPIRRVFIDNFLMSKPFEEVAQELAEHDRSIPWLKIYQDALERLTPRERQVEALYYGFVDQQPSQVAVARELGIGRARVGQLVWRLDRKLLWKIGDVVEEWLRPKPDSVVWAGNISLVGFSNRTFNCLRRSGYSTLEDTAEATKKDLMDIRGFGVRCLVEVVEKLAEHNLRLRRS